MPVEDELAAAHRVMVTLWGEVTTGRTHAVNILKKLEHLMSIHNDTKALLAEISSGVDALIAAKGNGDATIADLEADAAAVRDRINAALGVKQTASDAPSDAPSSVLGGVAG